MSYDAKKAAMLTAAISTLGLSLGISASADAQPLPAQPSGQQDTQRVLSGLNQPSSVLYRSDQLKWVPPHPHP